MQTSGMPISSLACDQASSSKYSAQVSAEPVVSCPATSIDSRSSRSCVESTSSRAAIRNRSTEGSDAFMYSPPCAAVAVAAAISSSSTISLHCALVWEGRA
eukprot:363566-Chlamydomonas_euryale.AAC.1